MSKWAAVFPGQGAQYVGMTFDLTTQYEEARTLFRRVNEVLKFDLENLCQNGPENELTLTANAQPAILTHSIILWEILRRHFSGRFNYVAGHSLGEYSALTASGVFTLETAVSLVYHRGLYMQQAVPAGVGAMAAVIGLPDDLVESICRDISRPDFVVQPANYNAPGQVVIAGHRDAVAAAAEKLKALKARIIPLKVSAPFHTILMEPAEISMASQLEKAEWRPLEIPWINNVTAEVTTQIPEAKSLLKRQITAPVLWARIVSKMDSLGVTHVVEIGPGKTLAGLIRRCNPSIVCHSVHDVASLESFLEDPESLPPSR